MKNNDSLSNNECQQLSNYQALIVSGYTGYLACDISELISDIEHRIGKELGISGLIAMGRERISVLYKEDFEEICGL